MARQKLTWDTVPAFADDEELGEVVLGWDCRREFRGLAELHEPAGMPRIDPVWGGRYARAVPAFFDHRYGLRSDPPVRPPGREGSFHTPSRRSTLSQRNPPNHTGAEPLRARFGYTDETGNYQTIVAGIGLGKVRVTAPDGRKWIEDTNAHDPASWKRKRAFKPPRNMGS
jgi:hypothetical protein